ncbi:ABCB family ABC transporter ATP-binding protein/permease [Candidatus Marimicrobium litorale]|uniref:ABC transporter ATP-binding protein/permease n=1 Tax=Candidatus Marimicrobium litorale TaxID=2518991 RepID=A0ABT3T3E2_9GAMM|nr:ABC transporter ATP-binding protein/permease [Candidatus Marimicrobium litorale]MCX2976779.1 ABC transporter ATP-binding protein/permease [Candidatus Marimicrobium litorale]
MQHGNYEVDLKQKINWHVIRIIWPYLMEHRARVYVALGCLILAKLANVVGPFILKYIVDALETDGGKLIAVPMTLVFIYGFARFANVLLGELRDTVFGRVTERAMRKLGLSVFVHLHNLDLEFHLNRRTGGLSRDIERGTTGISFLMRFFIFNIVPTFIEIFLVVGILLYNYGWGFALITLIAVLGYVWFSVVATEWRTRFVREANEADSATNTRAVDSLLNFETVKYFTNEEFEAKRYDFELERWETARRKNRLSLFSLNGGQALIIATAMTLMMWLAAHKVAGGAMTIGDFVLINAFMIQLFLPLNFLGFVYREIKGSMANIERMLGLLEVSTSVVDLPDASELPHESAAIEFKDVCFSYGPDRNILERVNFTINPNEKVAIVGASGAGKSTLVKLLFRFYDLNSGEITIGGKDISKVSKQSLRSMIGIVPQDTVLFNDSILENVRYGRPEAPDEEVLNAIRLAHLDSFIAQLPDGYNTAVGERGLKLSGGEKQRVAIARTILKRSPVLVFDEATSSLDSKSEQAILQALKEVARGHTSMVIAHRLSTVVDADKIVVLDQGRVIEQGTHKQLIARSGVYAMLWLTQQKEDQQKALEH